MAAAYWERHDRDLPPVPVEPGSEALPGGGPTLLTDTLQRPATPDARIHIVLLLDQFPEVLGGGERVVLRTADLLVRAGYRVSIVTFAVLCPPAILTAAACPVYLLPLSGVFQAAALRAAWQFGRFLRRERVRVVQTYFESSNLFGGIATKLLSRARLVWNRRDMGILREGKHHIAYRYLHALPDAVIAVSEQVREHAMRVDRIPPDRVFVIYNGVDGDRWQGASHTVNPTAPHVVTVGNIRPVKGHDTLVEAAAQVLQRHPEARFTIAGEALDSGFFHTLQQRAQQPDVADRIAFAGSVPDPSVLLREANVFVLPSRSEGFSNAIVEAMMAGLPVVATTVGGNGEAVVHGETGLLVPPDDPAALAAALNTLLDNPVLQRQMGDAGRARALRLFTEESLLRETVAVFDRVLA